MSEQAYEPVALELGGQTRTLRLTLRALRLIKQHAGADVFSGGLSDPGAMIDHIGVILWAMLGDPELTIEQVEDMVEMRDIDRVTAAFAKVMETDLPVVAGTGATAGKAEAAAAST
jgi:hypothetical protein